jgi:hypothetical protein
MIAHGDRENLLRLVLLDYKPVEVRLDVARQEIKDELLGVISIYRRETLAFLFL